MTAGPIGVVPGGLVDLPRDGFAILDLLQREERSGLNHHKAIVAAIIALRIADAVIAGPFSPDDANEPGLVPHLADLAGQAYRAFRPPRDLVVHPGFTQIARRFQFIQMSHHEARTLAAGAIDIGILAKRLRQLQGDNGEFAITASRSHGVLWAEDLWWVIDPISDEVDELKSGAAFCAEWVVARRFLRAPASKSLSYARSAAANSVLKKGPEIL